MECFLVKVDVFMEWKCQPTGIVEFLRLNSRNFWSGYESQWNKPLEINQKKESFVGFVQGAYYANQYQYISGEYSPYHDAE